MTIMALISVMIVSCHSGNKSDNQNAAQKLEQIRKYNQAILINGETSINVYVKTDERVDDVCEVFGGGTEKNFFWITFVDKNAPEVNPLKGEKNEPLRRYVVNLNKGENILTLNKLYVKTTQRTVNIHYIYE